MSVDLKDRVCVVTGSARSIGLGLAQMYCELGAKVSMIDINPEVLKQAKKLEAEGYTVLGDVVDITDQKAVLRCFEKIVKDLGKVFCLANVAGYVSQQPFEKITPEEIDKVIRVNLNGTIYCCQAALKSMKNFGDGRIINFSSKSGKTGSAIMASYSAVKGAIIALTQAMAYEFADQNIKVNCVCPGIVEDSGVWSSVSRGYVENMEMSMDDVVKKFTAKVPLGRLCRIEDVVTFCRFLTLDGDYCTGQAFNITGGREMH